jgi:hypothetical protein
MKRLILLGVLVAVGLLAALGTTGVGDIAAHHNGVRIAECGGCS